MPDQKINVIESETNNYCKFPNQCEAQPAFIEICPEHNTMSSGYSSVIGGGCSGYLWHNRELQYGIPSCLTTYAINALLEKLTPLAQRVCDGYSCEWNGSNHVGVYDEDAQEACAEIESIVERNAYVNDAIAVYDAVCDFAEYMTISEWVTDSKAQNFDEMLDFVSSEALIETEVCFDCDDIIAYIADEIYEERLDYVILPGWMLENAKIKEAIKNI